MSTDLFVIFEGKRYRTMEPIARGVLLKKTGTKYAIKYIGNARWIAVRFSLHENDPVLFSGSREAAMAGDFVETPLIWKDGGGNWKKLGRLVREWCKENQQTGKV